MKRLLFVIFGVLGCVDNTTAPPALEVLCENFVIQGEVVQDTRTGLVWDRFVQQSFHTHDEATAICAAKGARLPTRAELLELRQQEPDDACQLSSCGFYGARCLTIQCGSEIPGTDSHWGVAMSGGSLVAVPQGQAEALLCVRDAR